MPAGSSGTTTRPGAGTGAGAGSGSFSGGGSTGAGQIGGGGGASQQAPSGGNQVQESPQQQTEQQAPAQQPERHEVAQTEAVKPQEQERETESQQQQRVIRPGEVDISATQQIESPLAAPSAAQQEQQSAPSASGYEQATPTPSPDMDVNALVGQSAANMAVPISARAASPVPESSPRAQGRRDDATAERVMERVFNDTEARNFSTQAIQDTTPHKRTKPVPVTEPTPTSSQPSEVTDEIKRQAKQSVGHKNYSGDAISEIMHADPNIKPIEVSVGSEIISYVLAQPNSKLGAFLAEQSNGAIEDQTSINEVMRFVNSHNYQVTASKSPINRPSSTQRRVLRIHEGRGVRIHPTQAKSYNADFDSDQMSVAFDFTDDVGIRNAMSYLIDIDGQATIDPDFFPMPVLQGTADEIKYLDENVLTYVDNEGWIYSWSTPRMRNAIISLSQDVNDNDRWVELISAMSEASIYKNDTFEYYNELSNMLSQIFSGLRMLKRMDAENDAMQPMNQSDYVAPLGNADMGIMHILDTALGTGTIPQNFADFRRILARFGGEIEGKNAAFRLGAQVAKLINWHGHVDTGGTIRIGKSDMWKLYHKTMQSAMTRAMSNAVTMGDRTYAIAEELRNQIIQEVGFPQEGQPLSDWLPRFVQSYRRVQNLINASGFKVRTDYRTIDFLKKEQVVEISDHPTISEIVTPLIKVFGSRTMSSMFSGFGVRFDVKSKDIKRNYQVGKQHGMPWVLRKYWNYTLSEFSERNDVALSKADAEKIGKKELGSYKNDDDLVIDLIKAIADKKSSRASKFNTEMAGTWNKKNHSRNDDGIHKQLYDAVRRLRGVIRQSSGMLHKDVDYEQCKDALLDILYAVNPNMFAYYNMTSSENFINSKYGRAILKSKSSDQVGGIRLAMVVEYHLGMTERSRKRLVSERKSGIKPSELVKRIEEYSLELDLLAQSSDAWETVVSEIRSTSEESAFTHLKNSRLKAGEDYGINIEALYYDGWATIKDTSLIDVLLDTETYGYEDKINILADVSRLIHHTEYQNSWAMAYQLEQDPGARFTAMIPGGDGGIFDALDNVNKEANKYDRASYKAANDAIREAYDKWGDKQGALESSLKRLAEDPQSRVEISTEMFADAVVSSKTYKDSEKSSQPPGPNALYQANMLQKAGGFFSDVFATDNNVVGVVLKSQVNEKHLVQILADPDKSMWVIDEYGRRVYVSRETLCGGRDEQNVWQWLLDHPRLALALRPHRANVIADADAHVFLSATQDLSKFIEDTQENMPSRLDQYKSRLRAELYDDPKFGALCALYAPTKNTPDRIVRYEVISNEKKLVDTIVNYARWQHRGDTKGDTSEFLKKYLGIEQGAFIAIGMDPIAARNLCTEITNWFSGIIWPMAKRVAGDVGYNLNVKEGGPMKMPRFEMQSVEEYYNVKQELNGAKTKISTSIEGQETFNLAIWTALLAPTDSYANLGSYSRDEIASLGAMLMDGTVLDESNVDDFLDSLDPSEEIVVKVPDNATIRDKTLDNYGQQVSSVSCYLILKRDEGAEKFNLKAKKLGDDGTNSITKFFQGTTIKERDAALGIRSDKPIRIGYQSALQHGEISRRVTDAYRNGGIEQAKMELAQILKKANEDLGYKDMDLANYVNIADFMITINPENDRPVVRSIEQIIYAVKHRISWDLIDSGSIDELRTAASEIAKNVGIEPFDGDPSSMFDGIKIHGISEFAPVIRERSSSWHRNYGLLQKISKTKGNEGIRVMSGNFLERAGAAAEKQDKTGEIARFNDLITRTNKDTGTTRRIVNYQVLGHVGEVDIQSLGPQSAYIVTDPVSSLGQYYRRGNTVFVKDPEVNLKGDAAKLIEDCIPVQWIKEDGWYMLPMFDMQLNGSKVMATSFGKIGSWQASDDSVVWGFEDTQGEYAIGDATVQLFNALVDRMSIHDSGELVISMADLFPDTFAASKEELVYEFHPASDMEIQQYILQDREEYTIDYGVTMSNHSFDTQKARIDKLIQEYRDNYQRRDENGWITTDCHPNMIIGWIRCDIINDKTGKTEHIFAPVIPWKLGGTSSVPTTFDIDGFSHDVDWNTNALVIPWQNTTDPTKGIYKLYDGSNASNKMVGAAQDAVDGGQLRSGIPIDFAVAEKSTASRRLGTDKRMDTMTTMFFAARMKPYGYNFAECEDAFPDNPEIKQDLLGRRIPDAEWQSYMQQNITFSSNQKRDAFIKHEVKLCLERGINPSDFLASQFGGQRSCVHFEYQALMETSYEYQDSLLDFFHHMMPTLCPESVEGEWRDCLFRPCMLPGYDYGCMQMQVPHHSARDGSIYYAWENVYAGWSFFGQEYTGFHQPNINASSKMMDQLNTLALSGRVPQGFTFRSMLKWATSDMVYPVDTKNSLMVDIMATRKANEDEGE